MEVLKIKSLRFWQQFICLFRHFIGIVAQIWERSERMGQRGHKKQNLVKFKIILTFC